jgi:hypothetical protein
MWKAFPDPNIIPVAAPGSASIRIRDRVLAAKSAYTTRLADLSRTAMLLDGERRPEAGDLVLARVAAIGQHTRLELGSGRRATLHVGDEIVVCYGARYAPDQFEAYVPDTLGPCDLVAAGGIAARAVNRHRRMKKATRIEPIGILADRSGHRINLSAFGVRPALPRSDAAPVIAVLGSSMNAGKTTTAAALVHGYRERGMKVAAAKVTGTGAGGDRWTLLDAGACRVLDFTDAGVPSTFGLDSDRVESIFLTLLAELQGDHPDVIILEVADGLCQEETAALIARPSFREHVGGIFYAAADALGAAAGSRMLEADGFNLIGVSGAVTASPLASREAEALLETPLVTIAELADGSAVPVLPGRADAA